MSTLIFVCVFLRMSVSLCTCLTVRKLLKIVIGYKWNLLIKTHQLYTKQITLTLNHGVRLFPPSKSKSPILGFPLFLLKGIKWNEGAAFTCLCSSPCVSGRHGLTLGRDMRLVCVLFPFSSPQVMDYPCRRLLWFWHSTAVQPPVCWQWEKAITGNFISVTENV